MKFKLINTIFHVATISISVSFMPVNAQTSDEVRESVYRWANESLHVIEEVDLNGPIDDLRPLSTIIGNARIVGLTDSVHSASEPMLFRNRVFRFLVEEYGFAAIALESGLIESRVLNDYVTGKRDDFQTVLRQGFSQGFELFHQNVELIRWLREHNDKLPRGARKVQVFGIDVSGSLGMLAAARTPETALDSALDYLQTVEPDSADELLSRIRPFYSVLSGTNGYGTLPKTDRDTLSGAIADLNSLLKRQRFEYIAKSSEDDYEWGARAATVAGQVDSWFRRMPDGWKLEDGLVWTQEGQKIRDRAMADNLEWILERLQPDDRIVVFAAVGHIAATPWQYPEWFPDEYQFPGGERYNAQPLGAYIRARYGADFVNVLNLVAGGSIAYCSSSTPRLTELQAPETSWIEDIFASVGQQQYFIDLESAPSPVKSWLNQEQDQRNVRLAPASAFDVVYFVDHIESDCTTL